MAHSSNATATNNVSNVSVNASTEEEYSVFKPITKLEVNSKKKYEWKL